MSSPPRTPNSPYQHRRRPSSIELSYNNTPARSTISRRSSTYSPVARRSSHGFAGNGYLADEFADTGEDGAAGGGLGNLADELADVWSEEEEGHSELSHVNGEGLVEDGTNGHHTFDGAQDSGIGLQSSPPVRPDTLSPIRPSKHRRKQSRYKGSDYGDESDVEASEKISPELETQLAAVESLATRGLEENGSDADTIVSRVLDALGDLGSQSGIEVGVMRLTTAHTALSTHLTHQTRTLASVTSTLLSPLSPPPLPDLIDVLLPLIADTLPLIPRSPTTPLYALHTLSNTTRELIHTLSYLSDTLQIARATHTTAARRLRTVTEALGDWKRERERGEEARRWIERGGWQERLARRECGRECGEVVRGFESVCDGWRRRLAEGVEVEAG